MDKAADRFQLIVDETWKTGDCPKYSKVRFLKFKEEDGKYL